MLRGDNSTATRPFGKRSIYVDSKASPGIVKSHITVTKDLEKYFRCYDFFSSYDEEIRACRAVMNIPVLSIVLPLAWITGADVYVDELDGTFAASMDALQLEYKKNYPKAPFKTKLIVNSLVEGDDNPSNTAILFSGGIDSTYSLYKNIDLNPRLIMIIGTMDIPISNIELQERIKTEYDDFAEREGFKLNFIRTNALEIFDHSRLRHLWGKFQERHEGDYWNGIGFSLHRISQVAPLSVGRFNRLLVAASYEQWVRDDIDASARTRDETVSWANLNVNYDGDLRRYEIVFALKNLLINERITLRVCLSTPEYLYPYNIMNCSRCEKCLRTIVYLVYAGIDPNNCGFNVDDSTFDLIRYIFEEKLLTKKQIELWWKPF